MDMNIDCMCTRNGDLLVVASDLNNTYLNEYRNDHTYNTITLEKPSYNDSVKGICTNNGHIYFILSSMGYLLPYDSINKYDYNRSEEYGAVISSYNTCDDRYSYLLRGVVAEVVDGHLIYGSHCGISIARYNLEYDEPSTNISSDEVKEIDLTEVTGHSSVHEYIRIITGRIPVNIYHYMNKPNAWSDMSRITGLAIVDGHLIVAFNLIGYPSHGDSTIAKYDIKNGELEDYKTITDDSKRIPDLAHMNYMKGNGRLMIGTSTCCDIIYIMDKDMNIIGAIDLWFKLEYKIAPYKIGVTSSITIDSEDNIHIITDDRKNIVTVDLNGKLLNMRSSSSMKE